MEENNFNAISIEETYRRIRSDLRGISVNLSTMENCKGETLKYLAWGTAMKIMNDYTYDWSYKVKRFGEANKPYEVIGEEVWNDGVKIVDHLSYMVETEVTIKGITRSMRLPIINSFSNKVIQGKDLNSQNLNKTIWRCLVKNLALFGLGEDQFASSEASEYDTSDDQNVKMPSLQQAMNFTIKVGGTNQLQSLRDLTDQIYLSKNKDSKQTIDALNILVAQGIREAEVIINAIISGQYPLPQ